MFLSWLDLVTNLLGLDKSTNTLSNDSLFDA